MAKIKEKFFSLEMSQAFIDKTKQELCRLKENVALSLKKDIQSLFDDELHSDLVITNGSDVILAHKCILKARSRSHWQDSWVTKTLDPDGNEMDCIEITGLDGRELNEFIRDLYVVSDTNWLLEEYHHCLPGDSRSISDYSSQDTDSHKLTITSQQEKIPEKDHVISIRPEQITNLRDDAKEGDISSALPQSVLDCSMLISTSESDTSNSQKLISADGDMCVSVAFDSSGNSVVSDQEVQSMRDSIEVKQDEILTLSCSISEKLDEVCSQEAKMIFNNNNKCTTTNICEKTENEPSATKDALWRASVENGRSKSREVLTDDCKQSSVSFQSDSSMFGNVETCTTDVNGSSVDSYSKSPEKIEVSDIASTLNDDKKEKRELTKDDILTDQTSDSVSLPYETCSPLGKDLLQLYLEETDCDCCLAVDGIKFLVHKCVLSTRSEYFQAMLGGQWCESKMEAINLEGVTPQAVEQLLLFLYGGVLEISTPCELTDLFIVADMYGIASLKKVLAFYLRKDLCHFFHKPCFVCTGKAAEALSLCYNFNLDELQDRVVKWVAKYFTKIWPTKSFASLPESVQDLSVEGIKSQMTSKNVLDIIMECNKLIDTLPRIKWTESVLCLLTQLMDTAIEFTSSHFIEVISTQEFHQWAKVASWKAGVLEEIFNTVIDSLPINISCQVYEKLTNLEADLSVQETSDIDVVGLLQAMIKRCEKFFKIHINQIMRTKDWAQLRKPLQSKILESSAYMYLGDVTLSSAKSKFASRQKVSTSVPGNKKVLLRSISSHHSNALADKSTKAGQSVVQLRNPSGTSQKERPKSSITLLEQAKRLEKSEKMSTSKNVLQPKARYTIASFGSRLPRAEPINSSHIAKGEVSNKPTVSESSSTSSNTKLSIIEGVAQSDKNGDQASCSHPVSSHQISAADTNTSASSSSTKCLPSRIPMLTRSPKVNRPKHISKNESSDQPSSVSQNLALEGEETELSISIGSDKSVETKLRKNFVDAEVVDMSSSATWSEKSEMTESALSTSLSMVSPPVEHSDAITNQAVANISSELTAPVNIVTMSKTLNIGFTVPAE
ncbi:BTB/POZ domain-containing protein 8 [Biomphalaria glabrata]|nr:BTB/POZ domain-containing protein 8 [Biomphalaria glabrata]